MTDTAVTPETPSPASPPAYDPRSFWCFAADDGRVFKVPACVAVGRDDPEFKVFVAALGRTPGWPHEMRDPKTGEPTGQTDAALDAVLRPYGLSTKGPVRSVRGPALVKALDKATKVCPRDLAYVAGLDAAREDMPSLVRIAAADGADVKAWFDRALGLAA